MKIFALLLTLLFACNHVPAPQTAVATYDPADVTDSVYKIQGYFEGIPVGSGTGWKLTKDTVITAGHVCAKDGEFTFTAVTKDDQEFAAYPMKWSMEPDLCIMSVPGVPGPSLTKLDTDVKYRDFVWNTGAPRGAFGGGLVPFTPGYIIGPNSALLQTAVGASGSPIYSQDGVVGVLVSTIPGTLIFNYETAQTLKDFLDE